MLYSKSDVTVQFHYVTNENFHKHERAQAGSMT